MLRPTQFEMNFALKIKLSLKYMHKYLVNHTYRKAMLPQLLILCALPINYVNQQDFKA